MLYRSRARCRRGGRRARSRARGPPPESRALARRAGLVGLTSTPMVDAAGTSSCSNSSRFAASSVVKMLTPVMLPPGRFRLATSPALTGSVAGPEYDRNRRRRRLRRNGRGRCPSSTITATCRSTSSAAKSRQSIVLALRPAIFDRDISALDIADFFQALDETGRPDARIGQPNVAAENPTTGIAGCCARAASGHAAAAPPSSVMNSRRIIRSPRRRARAGSAARRGRAPWRS